MGIRAWLLSLPLSLSLARARARDDRRSTSIQPIGRAAAAARRLRASSSADNVHRARVARRQHAPADALAQSSGRAPPSGTRVRAVLPAGERRAREFNVRAGQESKREVRDRRSVG